MKNWIVAGMMVFSLWLGNQAFACSCIGLESAKLAKRHADLVIHARVVGEKFISIPYKIEGMARETHIRMAQFDLEVIKTYKGRAGRQILTITTGFGGGDCGFLFELDKEYIVYASQRTKYNFADDVVPKYLYTDICMRTTGQVLEELKALKSKE
jgi:hypothetical protein